MRAESELYDGRGWVQIPIPRGEKGPKIKGWQTWRLPLDESQLAKFKGNCNVGILLGEPSGGLIDIDLDNEIARKLAPKFLPSTDARFGRPSNPDSHWLFQAEDLGKTSKFQAPNLGMIVELRSTGSQTVFPRSIHPSGETIAWVADQEPAKVAWKDLLGAVSKLAAATVIAANLDKGSFHHARLHLAGAFRKLGWAEDEAYEFISAVMEVAGAESIEDLQRAVNDTYQKSDNEIAGLSGLQDVLEARSLDLVKRWLGGKTEKARRNVDPLIEEINRNHCLVLSEGKTSVVRREHDSNTGRNRYFFMRFSDFERWLANRGGPRENLARSWMKSSRRREYPIGITMAPIGEEPPGTFNLWTGFTVESQPGSWGYMREHLHENIAGGDDAVDSYIMNLLALGVQQPFDPWGAALVIYGPQRTGKTTFADEYGALFGEHYLQVVNQKHLLGNFNSHLLNVLVLNANEAMWGGDRAAEQILKSYVTDKTFLIEPKGLDAFSAKNRLKIIVTGNEIWQVPVGPDSKRYAVFEIGTRNQADREFFRNLTNEMANGGRAAMLHELMLIDLTGFNPEDIPETSALAEQRIMSLRAPERWLHEVLLRGWFVEWLLTSSQQSPEYLKDQVLPWPKYIAVRVVQDSLIGWCKANRIRHFPRPEERGRLFTRLGFTVKKKSNVIIRRDDDFTSSVPTVSKNTSERVYDLPSLEEFRRRFAEQFRLPDGIWD